VGDEKDVSEAAPERTLELAITYCRNCHFLPRATWVAQELLHTFGEQTRSLALVPGSGGVFDVAVNGTVVFSNKAEARFPEMRELREIVARYLDNPPRSRHARADPDAEA
jgi:selenoprotein W-related protein